jgi:hypothetical protein
VGLSSDVIMRCVRFQTIFNGPVSTGFQCFQNSALAIGLTHLRQHCVGMSAYLSSATPLLCVYINVRNPDIECLDGLSRFKVHTDERTQVYDAQC